ncbi:DNA-3-methyladenine glycosylase family protein [Nocardioides bizhenqiangii]|uniref:DNA-3-methyladenine glycosylase 2 family protein n=1 Tax=Nocardioides bizhenqiangii TaxID=3095076 RepID=A0ABZ0ZKP5_9ACTN|nr:DNA-3-methyladenine glycosylase 2 family protein [Nocardioides sp. HM61]WQQ24875.1 DNA-3-methyladenine glycosylase 2 family protein [Nocardioides sp. HM61]
MDRPDATRKWRPGWPCPVRNVLAQQRRGAGDPTMRLAPPGERGPHWRASRTPEGPVTLAIESRDSAGEVRAQAWGPGAAWALDQLPDLLGAADDWTGFEARHPVVAEARRRYPHVRLGRTARPLEALVPTIIEQKVTGNEAFAGFRALVLKYGAPAPGPAVGLHLQPEAASLARIPSWAWLGLHIDPARSRAVVTAARHADALERIAARTGGAVDLDRAIRSLPGLGVWTSAEVRQRALGDPDAVSFGDYHVAKDVGWALFGREIDDREMHAVLEPWRPHRGRVPLLLGAARLRRPRRGHRASLRGHLPTV